MRDHFPAAAALAEPSAERSLQGEPESGPWGSSLMHTSPRGISARFLFAVIALLALTGACGGRNVMTDRMLKPTLGSAQAIDTATRLAVLAVVAGRAGGAPAWFIITETSDSADAVRRRVNWAPRLSLLRGSEFTQRGTIADGRLTVPASVDFSPVRLVHAAPDSAFPPTVARAGSVARDGYSPFVELSDGTVLNAPVIATASGTLDRVVQLDRNLLFAVMRVTRGYSGGRTLWYISTESSNPMVAAMEGATHAPALEALARAGAPIDDARRGIVAIINGPLAAEDSAQRHGLRSALRGEGDPQNILEEMPGSRAYTPVWDLYMAVWSPRAVRERERERLLGFVEVELRGRSGALMPMGDARVHPSLGGLVAAGVIVNCPVVAVF